MRPTKIFVDGINSRVRTSELLALFTQYGRVTECDIISNFGFVVRFITAAWLSSRKHAMYYDHLKSRDCIDLSFVKFKLELYS